MFITQNLQPAVRPIAAEELRYPKPPALKLAALGSRAGVRPCAAKNISLTLQQLSQLVVLTLGFEAYEQYLFFWVALRDLV